MEWLRPNHYVRQALTGHGDFQARLASPGLAESDDCKCCGRTDTVSHFLLECPEYEPQRLALLSYIAELKWPEAAHRLVGTDEAFRVFADFCRESLWLKGQDNSAREATEATYRG